MKGRVSSHRELREGEKTSAFEMVFLPPYEMFELVPSPCIKKPHTKGAPYVRHRI